MMGRDAALPLAPASVALGRGPSLCPHAVVRAPAARHALRPGRGPPAGGAQRVPDPASVSGWPAAGSAPRPAAGWPAADGEAPPTTVLAPEAVDEWAQEEWAQEEWAQPEDEQPTTVFNPSGLVAWALAPDDGPPTTVLHLDLPPVDEALLGPPAGRASTTGAHRRRRPPGLPAGSVHAPSRRLLPARGRPDDGRGRVWAVSRRPRPRASGLARTPGRRASASRARAACGSGVARCSRWCWGWPSSSASPCSSSPDPELEHRAARAGGARRPRPGQRPRARRRPAARLRSRRRDR